MRIIGIPARYGSRRFPGKLLADLKGKPVIRWVVESAVMVKNCKVIVATDDTRIRDAVKDLCDVVMTPDDLPSGTDRLAYALKGEEEDSVVINLQGDEPFITPEILETLFGLMENGDADIYTLAKISVRNEDTNRVKVVINRYGYALYFSRCGIPYGSEKHLIHIGIYGYTLKNLIRFTKLPRPNIEISEELEQLRALFHGWRIKVGIVNYEGISIDAPEDIERARKML